MADWSYQARKARGMAAGARTAREALGHKPMRAISTAAGRVARTGSRTQVEAELRGAARRGDLVAVTVKGRDANGNWRTRVLDSLPEEGGGGGGGGLGAVDNSRSRPVLDVASGRHPGKRNAGVDPADLLDMLAGLDFEDWWDFFEDWWDNDYG